MLKNKKYSKPKPRLLYVVNIDWYFENHWIDRALAAKKEGFSVAVLTNFSSPETLDNLKNLGIKCFDFNSSRGFDGFLHEGSNIFRMMKLIYAWKPNLIHSITIKSNILTSIASRFFSNTGVIHSVPGLGVFFSNHSPQNYIIKKIISFILRSNRKSLYVFENERDLNFYEKLNIADRQRLIHIAGAGIDTNVYKCSRRGNVRSTFNILFASRLLRSKGLDVLVDAAQRINLSNRYKRKIVINVAGIIDNCSLDALTPDEILKFKNNRNVKWHGQVKNIIPLIEASDLVALPSVYGEGIPRILIEAASIGRPVLATKIAGCEELIDDGVDGFLVDTDNRVLGIAEALSSILDDYDACLKKANLLRVKVEKKFSNDVVLPKFIKLYHQALGFSKNDF